MYSIKRRISLVLIASMLLGIVGPALAFHERVISQTREWDPVRGAWITLTTYATDPYYYDDYYGTTYTRSYGSPYVSSYYDPYHSSSSYYYGSPYYGSSYYYGSPYHDSGYGYRRRGSGVGAALLGAGIGYAIGRATRRR